MIRLQDVEDGQIYEYPSYKIALKDLTNWLNLEVLEFTEGSE